MFNAAVKEGISAIKAEVGPKIKDLEARVKAETSDEAIQALRVKIEKIKVETKARIDTFIDGKLN